MVTTGIEIDEERLSGYVALPHSGLISATVPCLAPEQVHAGIHPEDTITYARIGVRPGFDAVRILHCRQIADSRGATGDEDGRKGASYYGILQDALTILATIERDCKIAGITQSIYL
jgi:hypothetical protein